jgi:protein phosphatase
VTVCAATHAGLVDTHNDDAFLIADLEAGETGRRPGAPVASEIGHEGVLLVVCDGVGGAAGEVAAWIGSEVIVAALRASERLEEDGATRLLAAIEKANRDVLVEAREADAERRMGATCTACWIVGARAYIAQVGDSRGYLLRGGRLAQATLDQTPEASEPSTEGSRIGGYGRKLAHALGVTETIDAVVREIDLRRGDEILLCTDGLHHVVTEQGIREALASHPDPCLACQELVRLAVAAGAPENLTAVIARCDGQVFPEAAPSP